MKTRSPSPQLLAARTADGPPFAPLRDRLFPCWQVRNVRLFYVLTFLYHGKLSAGIWLFFFSRFLTNAQIGISETLAFLVGLLWEIPSGVIADRIGRKKTIWIGNLLFSAGLAMNAFGSTFWMLTLGSLTWGMGLTFRSGALEAITYDSLATSGLASHWPSVQGHSTIIAKLVSIGGIMLGGVLYSVWFRLPHLTFALISAVGLLVCTFLVEERKAATNPGGTHPAEAPIRPGARPSRPSSALVADPEPSTESAENTGVTAPSLRHGLGQQVRVGFEVFRRPDIAPVAVAGLVGTALEFFLAGSMVRFLSLQSFGLSEETIPHIVAFANLGIVVGTFILVRGIRADRSHADRAHHRWSGRPKRHGIQQRVLMVSLANALLFTSLALPFSAVMGTVVFTSLVVAGSINTQLLSIFINDRTSGQYRATTLSAVSLVAQIPLLVLGIPLGHMVDHGHLGLFIVALGALSAMVITGAWMWTLRPTTSSASHR